MPSRSSPNTPSAPASSPCSWSTALRRRRRRCVRTVRPETPEDGGVHGVATRRMTYMGYGGRKRLRPGAARRRVAVMIEKKEAVEQPGQDPVRARHRHGAVGPVRLFDEPGHAGERANPDVTGAEKKVFEDLPGQRGIPPRAEIGSLDDAKRYMDMGVATSASARTLPSSTRCSSGRRGHARAPGLPARGAAAGARDSTPSTQAPTAASAIASSGSPAELTSRRTCIPATSSRRHAVGSGIRRRKSSRGALDGGEHGNV